MGFVSIDGVTVDVGQAALWVVIAAMAIGLVLMWRAD